MANKQPALIRHEGHVYFEGYQRITLNDSGDTPEFIAGFHRDVVTGLFLRYSRLGYYHGMVYNTSLNSHEEARKVYNALKGTYCYGSDKYLYTHAPDLRSVQYRVNDIITLSKW